MITICGQKSHHYYGVEDDSSLSVCQFQCILVDLNGNDMNMMMNYALCIASPIAVSVLGGV